MMRPELSLSDLEQMTRTQLHSVLTHGFPLDLDEMADSQYFGVEVGLPDFATKLLWKTFRKTFYRDPEAKVPGELRGWNVKLKQNGLDGPALPQRFLGRTVTFGHYRVKEAEGLRFPGGYRGTHFLDYTRAGNHFWDLGRFGYTPLVAVNRGRSDLLLGWEVMKFGPVQVPIPSYWALRYDGPLEEIVKVPAGSA